MTPIDAKLEAVTRLDEQLRTAANTNWAELSQVMLLEWGYLTGAELQGYPVRYGPVRYGVTVPNFNRTSPYI